MIHGEENIQTNQNSHITSSNSYSRIDYFLVSNQLFPQIYDAKYETIVISDHGPVKLIYDMTKIIKGSCRWRLHPKWLHDTNFLEFVGTNIDEFFKINTNETSASVRWEAFKAYIRGQMISYTSSITNKVNLKLRALDEDIKKLEKETYEDELHTMPQQKDLLLLSTIQQAIAI